MCDIKYKNSNYNFVYRVSALIFNKEKTKILLFYGNDSDYYMLPGGKINELEESIDAIKREIKEELGWENLEYKFLGISEELVNDKGYNNHQINLIYKGIYKNKIDKEEFKGLEGDWINFKWVDVKDINNYKIYPNIVNEMVKDSNKIHHSIDNLIKQ